MEFMNRIDFAEIIYQKITDNKTILSKQFEDSKDTIGHIFIDDLLPENITLDLYKVVVHFLILLHISYHQYL